MNDIFTVAGIAIVSSGFVVLLKQYKPEYAFGAALAAGIILLSYSIILIVGIFEQMKSIINISGIRMENFNILLRCLGISMVTKVTSDTCKDCGQASIAEKVDFAGKVFIITCALPLFSEIFEIIEFLISL